MTFLSITVAAYFYLPGTRYCSSSRGEEVGQLAGKQWEHLMGIPCSPSLQPDQQDQQDESC